MENVKLGDLRKLALFDMIRNHLDAASFAAGELKVEALEDALDCVSRTCDRARELYVAEATGRTE